MAMARTRVPGGGGELTHSCTGQVLASWQNSLLRGGEYWRRRKNEWKVRTQVPRGQMNKHCISTDWKPCPVGGGQLEMARSGSYIPEAYLQKPKNE